MAKGKLIEQLDDAVEALVAKPDAPMPASDPRLAAILRIAGELRDLPRADFRDRLKAELAAQSKELAKELEAAAPKSPAASKPLITHEDIEERLKELEHQPNFIVHDVRAALSDLPDMSMRFLDSMNDHLLVVSRGRRRSHWERHLGSDEMIYVMDGETEVVTLTDDGPVKSLVHAGSLFVCPEGLWHRLTPRPSVSALYLTPSRTEGSTAKNPLSKNDPRSRKDSRSKKERTLKKASRARSDAMLEEHDLRAALHEVPHLSITADTTEDEANAAVRNVAKIGNLTLGVMSYSGLTPWERHPDGDELLLALDGELDVTVLTEEGPVNRKLRAGEAFVCPQGLWHRQNAEKSVSMLYGTPIETSEVSFADDPRVVAAKAEEATVTSAKISRSIMPFLNIEGAASAVEFYKRVFGATVLMRDEEPSGIVSHAMLKMGDTRVMLSDPTSADVKQNDTHGLSRSPRSYGGSPVHLYIYVADVDEVFKRAIEAGAKTIDVPEDREWGDRCGGIEDPYGHVWWVGTPLKDLPGKGSN